MSRSFKKHKVIKDYNKGSKTIANKKVRNGKHNFDDLSDGGAYKKISCSYDISDYMFVCNKNCENCEDSEGYCSFRNK